jgi:hypothetical protein
MSDSLSPEAQVRAAWTLARSHQIRAWIIWLGAVVLLPAAGWVGAKLDTRSQVEALERQVGALAKQQETLVAKIDALSAVPDGPIFQLRIGQRYATQLAIRANVVAQSSEKLRKNKLAKAAEYEHAYDLKIDRDHKSPSDAAELVLSVAVP